MPVQRRGCKHKHNKGLYENIVYFHKGLYCESYCFVLQANCTVGYDMAKRFVGKPSEARARCLRHTSEAFDDIASEVLEGFCIN